MNKALLAKQKIAQGFLAVREFLRSCFEPHRRAALIALIKASALLGALSELGWLLNAHYFSRRFPQLPISLAWSMLSVIFLVMFTQVCGSLALKLRGARSIRLRAAAKQRFIALLAGYVAGGHPYGEIKSAAKDSPEEFESSVAAMLLGLRGSALRQLCDLPEVIELRLRWIERSRTGDDRERRYSVERLSLLHDPTLIPVLENALQDPVSGIVASAARGLLQMPSYPGREELLRSLPGRPYLVRVLTACESPGDAPEFVVADAALDILHLLQAIGVRTGEADHRNPLVRPVDMLRASCSALAALGADGRKRLQLMSAQGHGGEAPAEALGEVLAAAARGGMA